MKAKAKLQELVGGYEALEDVIYNIDPRETPPFLRTKRGRPAALNKRSSVYRAWLKRAEEWRNLNWVTKRQEPGAGP